jgi:hypothetical protein
MIMIFSGICKWYFITIQIRERCCGADWDDDDDDDDEGRDILQRFLQHTINRRFVSLSSFGIISHVMIMMMMMVLL